MITGSNLELAFVISLEIPVTFYLQAFSSYLSEKFAKSFVRKLEMYQVSNKPKEGHLAVGRAVAFNSRDLRFESQHLLIMYQSIT